MIRSLAPVLVSALLVLAPAAAAQAVQGRLVARETQAPVRGGSVYLMAADSQVAGQARTDSAGRFTLQAPAPGSYWLLGSAPGYQDSETDLFAVGAQGTRVSFVIGRAPVVLDTVTAVGAGGGSADRLWYGGFHQRMAENNGGRFITAEQIQRQQPAQMVDLLRSIPSLEVLVGGGFESARRENEYGDSRTLRIRLRHPLSIRGHCWTSVYLNGMRVEAESIQNLNPAEIEGMEIYTHGAIPAQFSSSMGSACGVIVVWTKAR